MSNSLRITALAAALSLALAGEASAHAHLKTAVPAAGGTVTIAPTDLALTFSEGVNPRFTGVKVTGPGAVPVPTGEARSGAADDRTFVVPVTGPMAPGAYKVEWHALATDGHKTEGSYTFTVKP